MTGLWMTDADARQRILDVALGTVLLLGLAPLMLLIALLLWIVQGPPILFRQTRPGRGGRPFTILKFRTMAEARDAQGRPVPDADRLTRMGKALRATSLDELPQLLNVLRGEMSLVGPRPLLMEYLPLYTPEQTRRHEVRPGITGWAQVRGRNGLAWEDRFDLDLWYVENRSLALDLRILALTVLRVLRRDGVRAPGHATVPRFLGRPADAEA